MWNPYRYLRTCPQLGLGLDPEGWSRPPRSSSGTGRPPVVARLAARHQVLVGIRVGHAEGDQLAARHRIVVGHLAGTAAVHTHRMAADEVGAASLPRAVVAAACSARSTVGLALLDAAAAVSLAARALPGGDGRVAAVNRAGVGRKRHQGRGVESLAGLPGATLHQPAFHSLSAVAGAGIEPAAPGL